MLSRISYFVCLLLMLYTSFIFYPKWNQRAGEAVIGWDVSGYYWYLPSLFIYKDLKQQKFGDSIIAKYEPTPAFEQSITVEGGNKVITYTAGMSLVYLPFFTVAHLVARPLGYAADGFTTPYQLAILLGSLMVAMLGLWYLRRLLLLYYSDKIVGVVLLLLVFGSNYLNYSTLEGGLTHNWLFTIYVFILLNTHYFYRRPSYTYAIRIGLLTGLAILIRPSEIIAALIPLLWAMESLTPSAIKKQFGFLLGQWQKILVTALCAAAIAAIQVIYWQYVTGHMYVYSYSGRGFSWMHPHWADYMLSYKSGWITYTPLAVLFFIGIIPFLFRGSNKVAILTFFALNLYIVCAWNVWWYGGTGGRAMIQSYPILLFPLATLLQFIFERKWRAWVAMPLVLLLAYFNLWFTYNAHAGQGLFDSSSMTKAYYWKVIYRYSVPWYYDKLKDTDELFEGEPKNMKPVYSNNFENDSNALNNPVKVIDGKRSLWVPPHDTGTYYKFALKPGAGKWLRVQATFYCPMLEWETWRMAQLVARFEKQQKTTKGNNSG